MNKILLLAFSIITLINNNNIPDVETRIKNDIESSIEKSIKFTEIETINSNYEPYETYVAYEVEEFINTDESDQHEEYYYTGYIKNDPDNPVSMSSVENVNYYYNLIPAFLRDYIRILGWEIYATSRTTYPEYGFNYLCYGLTSWANNISYANEAKPQVVIHESAHVLEQYLWNIQMRKFVRDIQEDECASLYYFYSQSWANVSTTEEFISEAMEAYFIDPNGLATYCPRTYELINNLLIRRIYLSCEELESNSIVNSNNYFISADLSNRVRKIKAYAFCGSCRNITQIYYNGVCYESKKDLIEALRDNGVDVSNDAFYHTGLLQ